MVIAPCLYGDSSRCAQVDVEYSAEPGDEWHIAAVRIEGQQERSKLQGAHCPVCGATLQPGFLPR